LGLFNGFFGGGFGLKNVLDYIIALTNLYGFVHMDLVVEIYNMHHQNTISVEWIDRVYRNMPVELERNFIETYRDCFVHETIMEFHEFDYYLREKANKPFYIPEKEELLRYRDRCYFERNVHYDRLVDYIARTFYAGNVDKATLLAEDIQGYCEMNYDEKSHIQLFTHRGLSLQRTGCRESLEALIRQLCVHTRTWNNNGFTQMELDQFIAREKA
jgi:hypothetical protein